MNNIVNLQEWKDKHITAQSYTWWYETITFDFPTSKSDIMINHAHTHNIPIITLTFDNT